MTKRNDKVIWDYINSTWYGQRTFSHNENLSVVDNVLLSYGIPMAVYEKDGYLKGFCPYRININLRKGKHKKHFDMLMDEIGRINSSNKFLLLNGRLKVSGNY